jgi:nucleoid DNA-binding protein
VSSDMSFVSFGSLRMTIRAQRLGRAEGKKGTPP